MENIKLEDILKILEQFEKSSIDSLRYKTGEEEIELSRHKNGRHETSELKGTHLDQLKELISREELKDAGQPSQTQEGTESGETQQAAPEPQEELHKVISPIIGTFYTSPAPGKPNFVKPGDKVKKGDVLCIIEAMKVMNKIESDASGEIVEVVAEDGQAVEYGSELFSIRAE